MIRRSTAIATAAILLSLLVHFVGLSVTPQNLSEQPPEAASTDVVAMGNAFEDVAETVSEPVQPETAPIPDPPVETPPEPERAETPTTEVLVASVNPQQTVSPDTGSTKVLHRDTARSSHAQEGEAQDPESLEPSGGGRGTSGETGTTPPVEPDRVTQVPDGEPAPVPETVQADTSAPGPTPSKTPEVQQHAALPVQVAPTLPVAPSPEPSPIPVVPLNSEAIDPEIPEIPAEREDDTPDATRTEDKSGATGQAVATSPRPPVKPPGLQGGLQDLDHLRIDPSQRMESPLVVYQRDGVDLTLRRDSGSSSSGRGFADSRGPGNSDVTNYAGRVLVHLNRAPVVFTPARGYARVFFEIKPDGTLAWVDVIDSSGSREVNRAAKEQVRTAAPFPRPPGGASRKLSFIYRIH